MKGKLSLHCNPSPPLLFARTLFFNPFKRYGEGSKENHGHVTDEKAPSLEEEFKRVAEKKAKVEEEAGRPSVEQGVGSQTTHHKANDGAQEAVSGDSDVESVKKRVEELEPGADYRRRGD